MSQWVEKHRPKSYFDVKGQENAITKIKNFIEGNRKKNALLLYGPPGVGKTTLAHAAAIESNAEVFELNASDFRNKKKLQEVLKPAIQQRSLVKENKLILVDEADGISTVDRGGITELTNLIELSQYPVLVTANDVWSQKLSPLRKVSELLQLKEVDYKTIKQVLIDILKKEGHFLDQKVLTQIAIKSKGDLRAAINDLQTAVRHPNPEQIIFEEREREIDIFNALKMVFQGKPTLETLKLYDSVKMPLDEIALWVEENVTKEYRGEELVRAIEKISRADIFKGRIYKQQYWRFLVYQNILLSFGISASKDTLKTNFVKYSRPQRILKIWLHNQRVAKKRSIATKYAAYAHIGKKRAEHEFPIIKQILVSHENIAKELRLTEDELDYLKK